jgi:Fic family protein
VVSLTARDAARAGDPGVLTENRAAALPDKSGALSIELTTAQVRHVVGAAREEGLMSVLLSHRRELGERLEFSQAWLENPSLSRSLLIGLLMLAAFPFDGSYIGNASLAEALDLNASTCHRYLSTLLEIGLIERDPQTRLYRLPPT